MPNARPAVGQPRLLDPLDPLRLPCPAVRSSALPPSQAVDPETKNLRDGEYVGVRRFVRILEQGPDAKATVDKVGRPFSCMYPACSAPAIACAELPLPFTHWQASVML